MRSFIVLSIFITSLLAIEVTNGKTAILPVDKSTIYVETRGYKAPIFHTNKNKSFTIIAVPYRQKNSLEVIIKTPTKKLKKALHVKQGNYQKEVLQVEHSKVSPPKSVQKRIKNEYDEAMKIYSSFTPKRYWDKPFVFPLKTKITSAYGNARIFNNTLKSYHSGTDFRAPIGTPVYASNDGVIVLAKKRYYAGGSIVIDHGEGIYSTYYHLSKILFPVGTKVKRSQKIGLSGNTGRVTGPHLHFGIMLQGTPVDPINFIENINKIIK